MFSAIKKIIVLPIDIVTLFVLQGVLLFVKLSSFTAFVSKTTVDKSSSF